MVRLVSCIVTSLLHGQILATPSYFREFQTIGWNTPRTQHIYERLAFILAAIIVIGNIAIPISILIGWVTLPGGGM